MNTKIECNRNGAIKLDGKPVDMYRLSGWIITYNGINSTQYNYRTLPRELLIEFTKGNG